MINIIDTYGQIETLFDASSFDLKKWESYINSIYENSAHIFKDEVDEYISGGEYTFEKDFLPIINNVCGNPRLAVLHESFLAATNGLNRKILEKFGREIDTDIVLYLGLCNAAGWVTNINNTDTVLLGVEKIIELAWHDIDSMYALIYHELGHVYQAQHGVLEQDSDDNSRNFVWQLFTEGIAMCFEQMLVGDLDYYHQDRDGWKDWCDEHMVDILKDFDADLPTMTRFDQRYFGDWSLYCGHSDVGYYLGAKFVHYLLSSHKFDELIAMDIERVYGLYQDFVKVFCQ